MLLIKVSYFATFLTLLSLVVCQLGPGNYYITNRASSGEVLAASVPIPGSTAAIEPMNNSRANLEVWTFNPDGEENVFNIFIQSPRLFLSVVNDKVVLSPGPFRWKVTPDRAGLNKISPFNQQLIPNNLNAETSSGRKEVNLAPPSDSGTQKWAIQRVL